jgi:hypothetical protein
MESRAPPPGWVLLSCAQERTVAVFVAASDESDGGHHRSRFWHGGWIAPEPDWSRYFVPAWQERVLDAKPSIPYLHMTDIRDPGWCRKHGITWLQAQDKMDEAAILIDQMGSLYPITTNMNGGVFLDAHGKKKVIQNVKGDKAARFLVDHFSFNAYVHTVLHHIHAAHPEAEKVDFIVERKEGVFEKLKQFYDTFGDALKIIRAPELVKYLGEIIPGGKDCVPSQAADVLCWHTSRADLGLLKGGDATRAATILNRRGKIISLPDKIHYELAHAFAEKMNENSGSPRSGKGRTRSGHSRKKKTWEAKKPSASDHAAHAVARKHPSIAKNPS